MTPRESPAWVQTSTAGAIALGFERGQFHRGARMHCLNVLLTYEGGCEASCAFCGLGRDRACHGGNQEKSFIRVSWPVIQVDAIAAALVSDRAIDVKRACISMVTHPRAREDTIIVARALASPGKALSVLLAPSIVDRPWLERLRADTNVDKVGVAIDAATPALFDELRGRGVNGPHSWPRYWQVLDDAIDVFGASNTGVHLIVGLGETERGMLERIQEVVDRESGVSLFSFFPEPGSVMAGRPQPGIGKYRRVQLARQLLQSHQSRVQDMAFNEAGQVIDFGVDERVVRETIAAGVAFMTQGCKDETGFITCNRPYANCTPFQAAKGETRNFPFPPGPADIELITRQLANFDDASWVRTLAEEQSFLLDD